MDLSVAAAGGSETYASGFAHGLVHGDVPQRSAIAVLVSKFWALANMELVDALRLTGIDVDVVVVPPPGTWRARLTRGRLLRGAARRHRSDVLLVPRDVVPRTGIPYVMLAHNSYAWHRQSAHPSAGCSMLLRTAARRSARRAAALLAVSRTFAASMPDSVYVTGIVHHGCSMDEHHRPRGSLGPAERLIVSMIAHVAPHKRIEVVIDAVARASTNGRPCELRVYGFKDDLKYSELLEERALQLLGVSVLRGPVFGAALVAAYRESHVVVVAGSFETFCFPLLEGMRSGCVVVAPRSPLVTEICGDVAVTYEEGDPASLAQALRQAAHECDDRSRRGTERAQSFTWAETVERTIDYVRESVSTG